MLAFLQPLTMTRTFFCSSWKTTCKIPVWFLFTIGVFSIFSLLMKQDKISSEAAAELILLSHTFRSLCLGLAVSSLPSFIFRYAKVLVIRSVTSKAQQASKQPGQCAPWGLWWIISPAHFPQPVIPQDASSRVEYRAILSCPIPLWVSAPTPPAWHSFSFLTCLSRSHKYQLYY